jgi:hypothetical protein
MSNVVLIQPVYALKCLENVDVPTKRNGLFAWEGREPKDMMYLGSQDFLRLGPSLSAIVYTVSSNDESMW